MLTIEQVEGAILGPPEKVTPADIERAKSSVGALSFKPDTNYLLMLNTVTDYDGKVRYGGGHQPYRFVLQSDGTAVIDAPGSVTLNLPETFIPNPDAPLIPQIEQIIAGQQAGKP